ncbi:MAG: choice-of-anchor E domain-containing protein, partial [Thermoguttaceae bacterium]
DLSLPQFDPVNGTLSQVTLDLIGGLNTSFMVGNLSTASSSSGNVSSQSTFTISSGTLGLNLSPLTLTAGVPFSLQAGELPVYPLSASQMGLNSYNIPSALLQDFTGTGVVSLPASTSTQTILTYGNGSPYVNPPPSPTATMTAVATYYYSPAVVPEPSTFALLGVSIIGLLGYSWRRRK